MILSATSHLKHSAKCYPVFCRGDLWRTPRPEWGHTNRLNKMLLEIVGPKSTLHFLGGPQQNVQKQKSQLFIISPIFVHQWMHLRPSIRVCQIACQRHWWSWDVFGGKVGLDFHYLGNVFSTWPFAATCKVAIFQPETSRFQAVVIHQMGHGQSDRMKWNLHCS